MKKIFTLILTCIMLVGTTMTVYANEEWYELEINDVEIQENVPSDIEPYGKYIMNVQTSVTKLSSNQIGIRADVMCSAVLEKIDIQFTLQKKSGTTWVNVATSTASASNVSSTAKTATASGVSAGTYRGRVSAKVTDKYGYSESLTSYSGSIVMK